jgi:TolB-like protein/cytochrome c-type biogenesis protein CcmH/NrfG
MLEPRVTIAEEKEAAEVIPFWRRKVTIAGAIAVLVVIIGVVVWNFYLRPPPIAPASVEKMAYPLPEKPSVAVLPFVNMSGDPNQEFFSDGLSDQIIASLSKVPDLFVIARNSTFIYKRKPVKVQQVAEDLGVRYVLEGSVRKSEDKLRVTVQLIDALKGHHLWAEQYDREMKDVFAVQDDITMQILKALQVQLTSGPIGVKAKGTQNLQAYLKFLEAVSIYYQYSRDGNVRARQLIEEVIAMDPEYASAYAMLGITHQTDIPMGLSKSPRESLEKAMQYAKKAQGLDENNYIGYIAMVGPHIGRRDHENAIKQAKKAINLAPGAASPYASLGHVLCLSGRSHEAVDYLKKAIRIDPFPPPHYYFDLGYAYFLTGNYEEAVRVSKMACALAPDNEACHRTLAAAYGMMGKHTEARAEAEELLRIVPEWSIEGWKQRQGYGWKKQSDVDRFAEGLRRAGLPDRPPLPLPEKPSIAVLPFVNMSGNPGQEYFVDGITEEIITALSRISDLFVIARNSSFKYKGKTVWIPDVARDLGVRYVLEGSVRKAGDTVRITAQLIDGKTNHHVWAETYDRKLKDIFAIQDEVTINILRAVKVEVVGDAERTFAAIRTSNLRAYLKLLRGIAYNNQNKFVESRKAFEEALSLDPKCAATYGWLAWAHLIGVWFGHSTTREQSLKMAFEYAEKCLALDDSDPGCHRTLGHAYLLKREYEKAVSEGERSIELSPNSPESATMFGWTLRYVGRYEEAIKEYERAMRLDPMRIQWPLTHLCSTYLVMRRFEEAIAACRKSIELRRTALVAWINLVVAYSLLDRMDEAHAAVSEVLKLNPNFSVEHLAETVPYKNEADTEFLIDALRKAGMN